jgi:murein DD-endopeptidase MepM/ murein hydrolase activator NlpD
VKAFVRLAILILWTPALLLAQTPATQSPAQQTTDKKPAYAQAAPAGAQNQATSASDTQTSAQPEAAKPRVPGPYPVMSDKAKQRAHELYEYFARGQSGQLYAAFSPDMKKQSPESKIVTISKQITTAVGSPGDVLSESYLPSLATPVTLYSRTTLYSKPTTEGPKKGELRKVAVMVIIGVDEKGQLSDFQVQPVPPVARDEFSDYQDITKLRLPFNGDWIVLQGGRNLFDNANVGSEDNRYGVSFIFVKDGMTYENDGRKNTDYYCYGQPVLSPAAGTIVQESVFAQDHPPGRPADIANRGNYVVIAHGNTEYSLIPYLKAGSVKVKLGQRVKQGDIVGECGNSGSSPFPHVEYRLQNSKGFPLPKSMPAQFVGYTADGKAVTIGEPLRGQIVANGPKAAPVQTAGKPE